MVFILKGKIMKQESTENFEIDKTDLSILGMLVKDAFTPYTDIAKKILVSGGTIHVRMRKLEKAGIVKGTTIVVDHSKLGFDLTAFIGVYLQKGSIYNKVITKLKQIPEVLEAHYTTGNYSIFLKVVCRNTQHLREVLNDQIQSIEGVERTDTILSLEESINRPVNLSDLNRERRKTFV